MEFWLAQGRSAWSGQRALPTAWWTSGTRCPSIHASPGPGPAEGEGGVEETTLQPSTHERGARLFLGGARPAVFFRAPRAGGDFRLHPAQPLARPPGSVLEPFFSGDSIVQSLGNGISSASPAEAS